MRARAAALLLAATLAGFSPVLAQDDADQKHDGKFTGIAMVTKDLKWFELFSKPETPEIRGAGKFVPGERGAVALIFSNAEPRGGKIKIECDVTAFDPDGSSQVAKSASCYDGPYYGDDILTPALLDIQFEIGKDDPDGKAGFHITARDVYSGRSVKLSVTFVQDTGVTKS
jgi:hypothetical protein